MSRVRKEKYCGCEIRTTVDAKGRPTKVALYRGRERLGCILKLDPVNETGSWDCGVWQEVFEEGTVKTYDSWHDGAVDESGPVAWKEWIGSRIDTLRWSAAAHQLDSELQSLSSARTKQQFRRLFGFFDALRKNPHLSGSHKAAAVLGWATCLALLDKPDKARKALRRAVPTLLDDGKHEIVRIGHCTAGTRPDPSLWKQLLGSWFLSKIGDLCAVEDQAQRAFQWKELADRLDIHEELGLEQEIAARLMKGSKDAWMLHTLADHVVKRGNLDMAVALLEKAKKHAPRNLEVLGNLEALYLRLGESKKAEKLRKTQKRLLKKGGEFHLKGGDEKDRRLEELLARYNSVVNENYARIIEGDGSFDFKGSERSMPLAAEIEKRINDSWTFIHPWDGHRSFEIGRILSAGSAMYVGWLRERERYDEAASYLEKLVSDRELLHARIASFPEPAGDLLSNGIGACLDSGQEEHVALASKIVELVEELLPGTDNENILYSVACVSARIGQKKKALKYLERSLEAGFSRDWAAQDPDLDSLHRNKEFRRLVGKRREAPSRKKPKKKAKPKSKPPKKKKAKPKSKPVKKAKAKPKKKPGKRSKKRTR